MERADITFKVVVREVVVLVVVVVVVVVVGRAQGV
jgi:uncharacterized membrane protein